MICVMVLVRLIFRRVLSVVHNANNINGDHSSLSSSALPCFLFISVAQVPGKAKPKFEALSRSSSRGQDSIFFSPT